MGNLYWRPDNIMPRVQKRPERKIIRRKCHHCGNMATNPFVYHIVPSYKYPYNIPIYQKGGVKTKRVDLKGDRKIKAYHFCDNKCYAESSMTN